GDRPRRPTAHRPLPLPPPVPAPATPAALVPRTATAGDCAASPAVPPTLVAHTPAGGVAPLLLTGPLVSFGRWPALAPPLPHAEAPSPNDAGPPPPPGRRPGPPDCRSALAHAAASRRTASATG